MSSALRPTPQPLGRLPRIGFVGVGWIGRARLEALRRSGDLASCAVADPDSDRVAAALERAPGACEMTFPDMLDDPTIDGVVIATPSGQHAGQASAALRAGKAVFCQKPLGRNAKEVRQVIDDARSAYRLLSVDFGYRCITDADSMRQLIASGSLGKIYACELTFHNAYGPSAGWAYDSALSGGGCLLDLGIHLLDLAFWVLGSSRMEVRCASLCRSGRTPGGDDGIEDYAAALLTIDDSVSVSLNCSWALPAGCDAAIGAKFYGTRGGVGLRNAEGSFYDFAVERYEGPRAVQLEDCSPSWADQPIRAWAHALSNGRGFDPEVESAIPVSAALDAIYAASEFGSRWRVA